VIVGAGIHLGVPLKLVRGGEYGVLEPDGLGVVAGIDRRVDVEVRPRPQGGVRVHALGAQGLSFAIDGPDEAGHLALDDLPRTVREHYPYVCEALDCSFLYAAELGLAPRGLELSLDSSAGVIEVPGSTPQKLGLGTSAAVTVGTVAAALAAHGVPIDRPTFRRAMVRLCLLAHHRAQGGVGSGIDVAAAAHGGILAYTRGNAGWLERMERRGVTPLQLARTPWPGLHAEALPVPKELRLLCGFTGRSSGTTGFVRRYRSWAKEQPDAHERFVKASKRGAQLLAGAIRGGVHRQVFAAVAEAQQPLDELMRWSGLRIVTPRLRELVKIAHAAGGAAKVSGAGGGDCGIAFAFDERTAERITRGWREADIVPIPLAIDRRGLSEDRLVVEGEG
jgi:ERG8-type phosphomevalonate kinase